MRWTRRLARPLALALALLLGAAAAAAPAAWHLWRSKSNGQTVCAQMSPGEGWEQVRGPFRDPHCAHPGRPGR